jgi:bacillopeptidase F (M6 metalloprotease family)
MNTVMKLACCAIVTSLLVMPAVLAKQISLSEKIDACGEISDNQLRLSCFDQLSNGNIQVTKSVEPSIQKSAQLSNQQIDAFAKEQVKSSESEQAKVINSISATVDKLSQTVYGQWKITFKNGQKWQQKDTARFSLKVGQRVIITKGALSAIYLKKEGSNKRIKVKRLK